MNKLKAALSELEGHLGRDVRGRELLSVVARIANQYRKDLASVTERQVLSDDSAKAAQQKIAAMGIEIQRLNDCLYTQRSQREQAQKDVQALHHTIDELRRQVEELMPEKYPALERTEKAPPGFRRRAEERSLVDDLGPVTELMNSVRCAMRVAPTPARAKAIYRSSVQWFEITDICRSLRASDLLTLGQFVAARAVFNFPCAIFARVTLSDPRNGVQVSESMAAGFVRWVRRSVDWKSAGPMVTDDGRLEYPK